jgi:hypothetical protein
MAEAATEWTKILWAHTEQARPPIPFYVGRLVDAVRHHVDGPLSGRSFGAVAKTKTFFAPTRRTSVDHEMLESLWLGIDCVGSAEGLVILRLLRKGLPTPTSIRYIGDQLGRASKQPVVATMIRRFVLGDYADAVFVAPFDIRARLNSAPVAELAKMITEIYTNRDVFYIVAEFLIAETIDHGALLHALRPTMRWTTYAEQIQSVTNCRLRPQFVDHCRRVWASETNSNSSSSFQDEKAAAWKFDSDAKPLPARSLIRGPSLSAGMITGLLSKLLRVRSGQLPRWPSTLSIPVMPVIVDFMRPTLGGGLNTTLLRKHGMSAATCTRLINAQETSRALTAFARSLTPSDRYLLSLAVAVLLHRNTTTVLVSHFHRPNGKDTMAVICNTCYTLCSRFKGDARRHTSQVNVCLSTRLPRCAVCQCDQLLVVPAVLTSIAVNGRMVTMCDDCGKLTALPQPMGVGFLCPGCAVKRRAAATLITCICGRSGVDVTMFAAMDGTELRMFAACPRHAGAVPLTTIVDIRAITARCNRDRHPYKPI